MLQARQVGKRYCVRGGFSGGSFRGLTVFVALIGLMAVWGCGGGDTPSDDCEDGYEFDGAGCVDIDECTAGTDNCDAAATCTNIGGSFTCACKDGYDGDGTTCTDIDECTAGTDNCAANATCANTAGSFTCTCPAGYEGDGTTCADIDECYDARIFDCDDNAACENTAGSYNCVCNAGFEGNGLTCTDIDECDNGEAECGDNATCENIPGSFTCTCDDGYALYEDECVDIDECALAFDDCADDAECTNTAGSWTCACLAGFDGDGLTCTDIDECGTGTDECADAAECTNLDGSYACVCLAGYEGDGFVCVDIDECATGTDECAEDAACTNIPGLYTCECMDGYDGNGFACTDIDECTAGTDNCAANATCANTSGSFTCTCPAGYEGDGFVCTDIDECATGTDECADDADCTNNPGSYDCTCRAGFSGDGFACADITHWVAVAYYGGGIGMVDTDTMVVHGPFLKAGIGSQGGGDLDLVVTPDGKTAIVSNFGDSEVYFIDISDPVAPAILGSVKTPMFAEDIAVSPDGRYALVTDGGFSPPIVVIDIQTRTIVGVKRQTGVYANAVEIAPDGTVITANYFAGRINTFIMDSAGQLTYGNEYKYFVRLNGDLTDNEADAHMPRPVNIGIAPDGVTVLVPDVYPYNRDATGLDPVPDNTGNQKFVIAVYKITAPGVLELQSVMKDIPRAVQSMAFDREGSHAYLLGNNGLVLDRPDDLEEYLEEELDLLMVADITAPGVVTFDPDRFANLNRYSGSQLFGVDGLAVQRGRAYASYPTISVSTPDMRTIAVVDLDTFEVDRLGTGGIISGISGVPLTTTEVAVAAGVDSCVGFCAERTASEYFYAGGFNRDGHCFCDTACVEWGDCCSDYDPVCTACDPETCVGDFTCANTEAGAFECACPMWTVDVGENVCQLADVCGEGGSEICQAPAKCRNDMDAGFVCECEYPKVKDGFNGCVCVDGTADDGAGGCVDIDECAQGLDNCHGYATCVNQDGGYYCQCPGEMSDDGEGGCICPDGLVDNGSGDCLDVNECALQTDECIAPATCVNYHGGYDCVCPEGSGMVNISEYSCACPEGFDLSPYGVCLDIDECALGNDNCVGSATCANFPGGFECLCPEGTGQVQDGNGGCVCPDGFRLLESGMCEDIDECAEETGNCVEPATCVNTPGSFVCTCPEGSGMIQDGSGGCVCPSGFVLGGLGVCEDVDECAVDMDNCSSWGPCVNTEGGYYCNCGANAYDPGDGNCQCYGGYWYDGNACVDVDECALGTDHCNSWGPCVNTVGGYFCNCGANAWDPGDGNCQCYGGYRFDGNACVDIDECAEGTDNCDESSTCYNYEGWYDCECPGGFYWDGWSCADIDECGWGWVDCGDLTCYNTPGSYYCE